MRPASVVILRETDSQATGGSCCGTLDGGLGAAEGRTPFAERRAGMMRAGELTRALEADLGAGVRVTQLDPRNVFATWFLLVRDCLRARRGLRALLRVLVFNVPIPSVFVDGAPVATGALPDAARVEAAVGAARSRSVVS